jgi:hypothetical protein
MFLRCTDTLRRRAISRSISADSKQTAKKSGQSVEAVRIPNVQGREAADRATASLIEPRPPSIRPMEGLTLLQAYAKRNPPKGKSTRASNVWCALHHARAWR